MPPIFALNIVLIFCQLLINENNILYRGTCQNKFLPLIHYFFQLSALNARCFRSDLLEITAAVSSCLGQPFLFLDPLRYYSAFKHAHQRIFAGGTCFFVFFVCFSCVACVHLTSVTCRVFNFYVLTGLIFFHIRLFF